MKRILRLNFLICLLLSNVLPLVLHAQTEKRPLKTVLLEVGNLYDSKFVFDENLFGNDQTDYQVVSNKNKNIEEVLKSLLYPKGYIFLYVDKNHFAIIKDMRSEIKDTNQLGNIPDLPSSNQSQISKIIETDKLIRITGRVRDDKNESLIGVSIVEKGSKNGTSANTNGDYTILVNPNATLVFSYMGFVSKEVKVNNQTTLNVQLQDDSKVLNQVVVIGYGTQKKEHLTGAVSTITSKELESRPVTSVAMALQGLAPGLNVTRSTGQPGDEDVGLQVRGVTSANGNVSPLIVVDGVSSPSVSLEMLNPNDIESVTILKDAASAAIYGAQAAGGVIMVTTKKGKSGKTVFNYSSMTGTDWGINVPTKLPTWEELTYNNLARVNSGSAAAHSDETIQILKDGTMTYRINPNDSTRWQYFGTESLVDQMLRKNTFMQTHNLSAQGGTDKLNFLMSLGYYDKQGLFKVGPDRNDRYNARLNLGTQLTKHLSLDSRLTYTLQHQETSSQDINGNGALLFNVYRYSSINPVLTPDGRYNHLSGATAYSIMDAGGYNNYDRNSLDGVFTAKVDHLAKGLVIKGIYGFQNRTGERDHFERTVQRWYRTIPGSILNNPNSYSLTNETTNNNNLQLLADYAITLDTKHNFKFLGGYQWEESRFENLAATVSAMVSNDLPSLNLGDRTTMTNSQRINTYAFQSYLSRFNYNFADKYLFEATLRLDESSRLAPGLRSQTFPSLSAGWNIHRESWFKMTAVNQLKLRSSWGRLGAASGIGLYDYLALMNRNNDLVLGSPEENASYFAQTSVPSSQLSWETIETTNTGVDVGLFKNKISASFDYYVKYNRNMLTSIQFPATFGVGTPRINNGELKSWGWETTLSYREHVGKDFTFSVTANLSDNQNKLINFSGRKVISAGTVGTIEGYPINSIWGYQTDGYFQTNEEVTASAFQDVRTAAGDVKYKDINGDNKITIGSGSVEDHGDLVYMGTTQARYLFGTNLNMQWKNFDFTVFFQGVGKRYFIPTRQSLDPYLASYYMPLAIHRDFWTPERPDAAFPRPFINATHNYMVSDKWIQNGRYVRLKNVQLGYSLPQSILNKVKISRARLYLTGQDLLTFSRLGVFKSYYDPEQRNNVASDYPFFATIAMGLNITF